jgi:DNA modification methylase
MTVLTGDWIEQLRTLEDASAQCCVTSPPYWGLRDYWTEGQLGLEKTPEEYVAKLVAGFAQVWRVLKSDGTLFLNLGDSYAANGVSGLNVKGGLKPKDLIGIPWLVAFALRAQGWYLRSDIIWAKPNCMPESVTDRPTRSHEYIFLFSKAQRYFYDAEAIKEKITGDMQRRFDAGHTRGANGKLDDSRNDSNSFRGDKSLKDSLRNKRDVWTVCPAQYSQAHFATFPPDLIKPCILAGSRPGDTILDPFAGSGTTGMVAIELGRTPVLIELNPEYVKLIHERCNVTPGLPL